ncbi:hypothetical protein GS881_24190 [Rhodococcus hoagii]|nr:hypothetical protein [Prescottella equi]
MTPQSWVLAVDFGTSNTAAAQTDAIGGTISTLPLSHHGNLLPSAVFVESPDAIVVGEVALNRAETNPAGFLPAPKRVHRPRDAAPQRLRPRPGPADRGDPQRGPRPRGRRARRAAARPLVLTPRRAGRRRRSRCSCRPAGLLGFTGDRLTTVSEQRAAAHFYARQRHHRRRDMIAVFDFGGGTLDIAVLSATATGEFTRHRGPRRQRPRRQEPRRDHPPLVDQELRESNPELAGTTCAARPRCTCCAD